MTMTGTNKIPLPTRSVPTGAAGGAKGTAQAREARPIAGEPADVVTALRALASGWGITVAA